VIMDQAEGDLNDEEVSCRDFGGPADAVVEVDLTGWAPADGVDACRRMTMRPSECAEKMASTTISSSTMFTAARLDCRDRPGAGAAVCTPRDVCGWLTPALLRAPGRPWRGCGWGDSASIRSLRIRKTQPLRAKKTKQNSEGVHRVSSTRIELKFSKAKAAVARLATLVHAPALDGVDPTADEGLVSLCDKVEEGSAEYLRRGEETVV
jgi:hypothetical protein